MLTARLRCAFTQTRMSCLVSALKDMDVVSARRSPRAKAGRKILLLKQRLGISKLARPKMYLFQMCTRPPLNWCLQLTKSWGMKEIRIQMDGLALSELGKHAAGKRSSYNHTAKHLAQPASECVSFIAFCYARSAHVRLSKLGKRNELL